MWQKTQHMYKRDTVYGMIETVIAGSHRKICTICNKTTHISDQDYTDAKLKYKQESTTSSTVTTLVSC